MQLQVRARDATREMFRRKLLDGELDNVRNRNRGVRNSEPIAHVRHSRQPGSCTA